MRPKEVRVSFRIEPLYVNKCRRNDFLHCRYPGAAMAFLLQTLQALGYRKFLFIRQVLLSLSQDGGREKLLQILPDPFAPPVGHISVNRIPTRAFQAFARTQLANYTVTPAADEDFPVFFIDAKRFANGPVSLLRSTTDIWTWMVLGGAFVGIRMSWQVTENPLRACWGLASTAVWLVVSAEKRTGKMRCESCSGWTRHGNLHQLPVHQLCPSDSSEATVC